MIDDFDCSIDDAMDSNNELNTNVVDQLLAQEELVLPSQTTTHFVPFDTSTDTPSLLNIPNVEDEKISCSLYSTDEIKSETIDLNDIDGPSFEIKNDNEFNGGLEDEENMKPHDGVSFLRKEPSSYAQSQIDRLNKWAEEAIEDEKWHYDQAEDASCRGDEEAARKHIQAAKQRHDDYNSYMRSIKAWKG